MRWPAYPSGAQYYVPQIKKEGSTLKQRLLEVNWNLAEWSFIHREKRELLKIWSRSGKQLHAPFTMLGHLSASGKKGPLV